ncbi:hypothetical protein [Paraburkholderia aspalathi]|uniref:hypothetical protein n=1 Tax=Paraburkholderia aspalathi TaxID=1324617 RepID=UPI001B162408|nr:hypothetical protein [Paraburkholderia aspalathi]CAE6754507.1 hypothetical protein R20943_03074 [Paraburkholderia aspalathi]
MSTDIHDLAARANVAETAEGFMNCTVESVEKRLLAFRFDNYINAHVFQAARESGGMQARIENDRQTIVIVHQPEIQFSGA